ncbi:phage tail protein [Escherichia albertii]|nr:phage tail protein [Escherichia albertii]MCZ8732117.1 phage tail protein [Escherichia albertii]MCZ8884431.1 phage tail protein [Escherichia albertii]MCZ8898258.1 phage tail protein [Escherichia albertii]
MATIITTAFEQWQAADLLMPGDISLDEFVLANVPGLDQDAVINRDAGLPDAAQIVYREPVNAAGVVNKNTVAYSFTLGTNVGNFSFNWIGLICKKTGLLAMVTTVPALEKVKTTATEQGNAFTRSFLIEFNGAAEKTGINTPAETWQIDFTARLTGIDDYQRLLNIDHYGSALFFDDGWLVQRSGVKYSCLPGLGYVAGLRLANEAAQDVAVGTKPAAVWLDTVWQGSVMTACVPVTDICVITSGDLAEYSDAAGKTHYVFKIAEIAADGAVTDLRPVRNSDDLDKRYLRRAQNLADLDDKGKSRVNLGLGGAAVCNVGQLAGQVAAADDPRIVHAVQDTRKVNNKALSADITLTYSDVNAVPTTRKVNDKALSADITLTYSDVNAVPTTRKVNNKALSTDITLTYSDVNAVPTTRKVNNKALSADITLTYSDVNAVPTTRKVNNKALTGDITLSYGDVGAAAASHKHPWADITGVPDFITVANADARYFGNFAMFTANGMFTVPAGVKKLFVEMIGGGGGGGSGAQGTLASHSGGYGGGAAALVSAIVNVTPAASLAVIIGAGGAGAVLDTVSPLDGMKGSPGGNTFFAGVSATGGTGANGGRAAVPTSGAMAGENGESSAVGRGGAGILNGSGAGSGYGAGGSGGSGSSAPSGCSIGGKGSPGFVKIWW